jgi:hypothetical protein
LDVTGRVLEVADAIGIMIHIDEFLGYYFVVSKTSEQCQNGKIQ